MINADQKPKGFFITGTDTGVGKTVATACLLHLLKKHGIRVGVMKPFETGVFFGRKESDAEFLIRTGGLDDSMEDVAPIRLKTPAAPLIAARIEDASIDLEKIRQSYDRLMLKHETVLIEGVGGLLVPIKENYSSVDLVVELGVPLILVAHPFLGTINHTLLTLEVAHNKGLDVCGIIINSPREDHEVEVQERSVEFIEARSGVPVIGRLPFFQNYIENGEFLDEPLGLFISVSRLLDRYFFFKEE